MIEECPECGKSVETAYQCIAEERDRLELNYSAVKDELRLLRQAARNVIDAVDPDHCRGSFGTAIERLDGFLPARRCNHWPGQKRCEVCGMDVEKVA
jgi:hypothetical protein